MDIPEHLRSEILAMAQAKFDIALAEIEHEIASMAEEYARQFIDVTDLADPGRKLAHVATGRVLSIRAKWEEP